MTQSILTPPVLSPPILTTGRLRLLPFTEADFPLLFDLHSDPEVNRYLSPGPAAMGADEVHRRLGDYVRDHLHSGISKWKLETKEGNFIGRAGFSWLSDPDGYELGYSLKRSAWGQGYATEISRALVGWFFEQRPDPHLIAYAVAEHAASQHVMQKAGFSLWQERRKHGLDCRFYRITRSGYLAQRSAGEVSAAG
ncbi:GNAT family N-acetyltransferase [Roseibium sp. M-1]